jgi:hypothetical protein
MIEEPLLDNISILLGTTGGFAKFFDDELDNTILVHEAEREQAPDIGVPLDSQQVHMIGTYVTLNIYIYIYISVIYSLTILCIIM